MTTERNRYYRGPPSDHFDGVRFFNREHETDKGFRDLLRMAFGRDREPWPRTRSNVSRDVPPRRSRSLRVVLVGHASILLQVADLNILIDPVWSERVSPVRFAGPKRFNPPAIAFDDLPPIDVVLLSHNHYDHMDLPTLSRLAARDRPCIVTPLGNDAILTAHDPRIAATVGDWGDRFDLGSEVDVTLHPANHWSARGVRDRRMALWCGFVLRTPEGTIYHSGDTGYGDGAIFRAVKGRFGAPRLALLPIGAYRPAWFMQPQHISPSEAVRIMMDTGAERALGFHWGTFRLSDEGIEQPATDLAAALAAANLERDRFVAMRPGDVFEFRPMSTLKSTSALPM